MDLPTIRKVIGHTADDVMLCHYDQRSRKQLREQIRAAMPDFLATDGERAMDDNARDIAAGMTEKTWKQDQVRLLALLPKNSNEQPDVGFFLSCNDGFCGPR